MRLVMLGREHRRLLDSFQCRSPELVLYLRRFALRHQERDRLSRTHLGLDVGERLAGYFTLAAASVERAALQGHPTLDTLPRFPVPAVLLARLAVDDRATRQGVGRWLFEEALRIALHAAEAGPLAARVLVADAKDESAIGFYERLGMRQLPGGRLMVADLTVPGPERAATGRSR